LNRLLAEWGFLRFRREPSRGEGVNVGRTAWGVAAVFGVGLVSNVFGVGVGAGSSV